MQRSAPGHSRTLAPALLWFVLLSAAFSVISAVYLLYRIHYDLRAHHGLPPDIYTRQPFQDTYVYLEKLPQLHTTDFFTQGIPFLYPAPSLLVYKFLNLFTRPHAHDPYRSAWCALLTIALVALIFMGTRFVRAMTERGLETSHAIFFALLSGICSWPAFYALHQGNIEAVLWLGVAAALWAYYRERWWLFAILLGVFGSAKLYPMVYAALFLPPQRYRELLTCITVFVAMSLGCMVYAGPTFPLAWHYVHAGLTYYSSMGTSLLGLGPLGSMWDHSLCGLLHLLLRTVIRDHPATAAVVFRCYMPAMAILVPALFFMRVWKLPRANQVLFLTLAMVLFPAISFDYTLQFLYIPWAWLVLEITQAHSLGLPVPGAPGAMALFAWVLSPVLFVHSGYLDLFGQSKAVALLALLVLALCMPLAAHTAPGAAPESQMRSGKLNILNP